MSPFDSGKFVAESFEVSRVQAPIEAIFLISIAFVCWRGYRFLEEVVRRHSLRKILKLQVLENAISAILKQSQRVVISHFFKMVETWL